MSTQTPNIIKSYSLQEVLDRLENNNIIQKETSIPDLKLEINILKIEIKDIQKRVSQIETFKGSTRKDSGISHCGTSQQQSDSPYLLLIDQVTYQKWYVQITIVI